MSEKSAAAIRRVNRIIAETNAVYHDASLRLGISDSVSMILYALCSEGEDCGLPLGEVCRLTALSKQTVNSAVRGLERDGFVRLEAMNGRAKRLRLTEKGKLFAERTAKRLIEAENAVFDEWSGEDIQTYILLQENFLRSLKEKINKF